MIWKFNGLSSAPLRSARWFLKWENVSTLQHMRINQRGGTAGHGDCLSHNEVKKALLTTSKWKVADCCVDELSPLLTHITFARLAWLEPRAFAGRRNNKSSEWISYMRCRSIPPALSLIFTDLCLFVCIKMNYCINHIEDLWIYFTFM